MDRKSKEKWKEPDRGGLLQVLMVISAPPQQQQQQFHDRYKQLWPVFATTKAVKISCLKVGSKQLNFIGRVVVDMCFLGWLL